MELDEIMTNPLVISLLKWAEKNHYEVEAVESIENGFFIDLLLSNQEDPFDYISLSSTDNGESLYATSMPYQAFQELNSPPYLDGNLIVNHSVR